MTKKIFTALVLFLCFDLHADDYKYQRDLKSPSQASIVETFELSPVDISILNPGLVLDPVEISENKGYKGRSYPGIGSAMIKVPGKKNEFFMLTDRGPNFDNSNSAGKVYGKIFPLENFAPAIVHVRLENKTIKIIRSIPILDSNGKSVTGIANGKDDETPYALDEQKISYRPGGIDTEALQLLPDGKFLISEEYGPSILVVDPNGQVLMRYMPKGKAQLNTPYPVKDNLPEILKNRRSNRGFENLALSPDGKTAYAVLQSPMGDSKSALYSESRTVRIIKLDCSDPLDIKATGMFVVLQSNKSDYPSTSKQADLKYSDAVMLSATKMLLIERATKKVKLIIADIENATDILNLPIASTLEPEEKSDTLSALKINPAETEVAFNSVDVMFELDTDKIEGLSVLSPSTVALSNDNDFALGENTTSYPSRVWYIRLRKDLPLNVK